MLCLALGGCADTVGGAPLPDPAAPPTSTSGSPQVDPDSREAQWINGFCGVGKLLVTAAETQPQPRTSDDPAALKREFSEITGRLVNVLDAALTDLNRLPPAPVGGMDDVVGTMVEHMTAARDATGHAKSTVDAADPLTVEAYREAIDELGRGVASMQRALDFLRVVDLPDELVDAASAAPNCGGEDGFPVGER